MSKRIWGIIFIVVIALAISGVIILTPCLPVTLLSLLSLLKKNEAPAWIQAIGSILAIVAAAVIARNQTQGAAKLEERKQAISEKQKFGVVMALMARAHGLANDITKAFETHKNEDFDQVSPSLMVDTHHALVIPPFSTVLICRI